MDDYIQHLYLGELQKQCEFIFFAVEQINTYLKNNDTKKFWFAIQSFLTSNANISKLLFPIKETNVRGQELRVLLEIEETSPLRPRDMRNHFEHFDERLDKFINESRNRNYVDSNIGPKNQFQINAIFQRHFDTQTNILSFQNDEFYMQLIVNEIEKLYEKINRILTM